MYPDTERSARGQNKNQTPRPGGRGHRPRLHSEQHVPKAGAPHAGRAQGASPPDKGNFRRCFAREGRGGTPGAGFLQTKHLTPRRKPAREPRAPPGPQGPRPDRCGRHGLPRPERADSRRAPEPSRGLPRFRTTGRGPRSLGGRPVSAGRRGNQRPNLRGSGGAGRPAPRPRPQRPRPAARTKAPPVLGAHLGRRPWRTATAGWRRSWRAPGRSGPAARRPRRRRARPPSSASRPRPGGRPRPPSERWQAPRRAPGNKGAAGPRGAGAGHSGTTAPRGARRPPRPRPALRLAHSRRRRRRRCCCCCMLRPSRGARARGRRARGASRAGARARTRGAAAAAETAEEAANRRERAHRPDPAQAQGARAVAPPSTCARPTPFRRRSESCPRPRPRPALAPPLSAGAVGAVRGPAHSRGCRARGRAARAAQGPAAALCLSRASSSAALGRRDERFRPCLTEPSPSPRLLRPWGTARAQPQRRGRRPPSLLPGVSPPVGGADSLRSAPSHSGARGRDPAQSSPGDALLPFQSRWEPGDAPPTAGRGAGEPGTPPRAAPASVPSPPAALAAGNTPGASRPPFPSLTPPPPLPLQRSEPGSVPVVASPGPGQGGLADGLDPTGRACIPQWLCP